MSGLEAWDGRATPEAGTPDRAAFDIAWGHLCEFLEHEEPGDDLPVVRLDVAALCCMLMAVNCDWLHTGVVLNQPELVGRVEQAASRFGLPATADVMRRVRTLVPAEILASEDFDTRAAWYEQSENDPDFQTLIDLSDVVTDGPVWDECVLAVVRAAKQHPEAFFESM